MEIQSWIIFQIVMDLIIAALLLWFVFANILSKRNRILQNNVEKFKRPEDILSEMREISRDLERNLIEKKDLSCSILKSLDEGLERGRKNSLEIQKILKEYSAHRIQTDMIKETEESKQVIKKLFSKGISRKEISQKLDIPLDEINLILKLQGE